MVFYLTHLQSTAPYLSGGHEDSSPHSSYIVSGARKSDKYRLYSQRIVVVLALCFCLFGASLKDQLKGLPLFSLPQSFSRAKVASWKAFVWVIKGKCTSCSLPGTGYKNRGKKELVCTLGKNRLYKKTHEGKKGFLKVPLILQNLDIHMHAYSWTHAKKIPEKFPRFPLYMNFRHHENRKWRLMKSWK